MLQNKRKRDKGGIDRGGRETEKLEIRLIKIHYIHYKILKGKIQ